jgi:hypothetical protein
MHLSGNRAGQSCLAPCSSTESLAVLLASNEHLPAPRVHPYSWLLSVLSPFQPVSAGGLCLGLSPSRHYTVLFRSDAWKILSTTLHSVRNLTLLSSQLFSTPKPARNFEFNTPDSEDNLRFNPATIEEFS